MGYKFINNDCLKVLNETENDTFQCVITSPPYNKSFFAKSQKEHGIWKNIIDYATYSDDMPIDEYEGWMCTLLETLYSKIKDGGSIFFNHKPIRHDNQIYHPLQFIFKSGLPIYQEIIWDRSNSPNISKEILVPCTERIYWITKGKPKVYRDRVDRQCVSEVWKIAPEKQTFHPAPFPLQLAKNCILLTTNKGDKVFDPFSGSGTTALACVELERDFVGTEISKEYCELATKRIEHERQYFSENLFLE